MLMATNDNFEMATTQFPTGHPVELSLHICLNKSVFNTCPNQDEPINIL